jgi:predicted transposase YbfD/YdcC
MEVMLTILRAVDDPRAANAQHDLAEILFVALAASLCGAQSCAEMAAFGRAKEAFLRQFLNLAHGIPSHDTFSRVFRLIAPEALAEVLGRVTAAMGQTLGGVVSLDGKSLRRGYEAGKAHIPPLVVSVWAAATRLTLTQVEARGGNETEAALAAVKLLDLKGCTLTADALHCHAEMASTVNAAGGDYILALKGSQSKLLAQAKAACATAPLRTPVAGSEEDVHGRNEVREAIVVPFRQTGKRNRFEGLKAAARITRERGLNGNTETSEQYYLLSRRLAPAKALALTRQHWDIENRLHWRLDVVFQEDRARTRKDHAPANLALLRRLTMNILQSHPATSSINIKRQTAGWNDKFLLELFTHMR